MASSMVVRALLVSLIAVLAACEDSSTQGEVGAHCYPNGTCNVGLSCSGGFCYPADAAIADASIADAFIDASPDAPPDASTFCNAFEPNETIQAATATPVMASQLTVTYSNVSVCPQGDRDTYAINVTTANTNLEVITTWTSGMPVSVSILGSGGATLGNGTSSGAMSIRAYVANLPVGMYYAQVYASALVANDYRVTITAI